MSFYPSRNLFIHEILFRGISLFLAMPFIESLDFVALDCFLGLRLRKLLLIHCHGLISWIHSIHDFGSFSVGSEIFLFRIYVLLMSWHTSRILFYCYGFTPWVSFIPGFIGFRGPGCVPGFFLFIEMILFYALAWCYGFMASHGIYAHGFISWIVLIHRIIGILCHGLLLFLESLGFMALDMFLGLRLRKLLLIHWILFRGMLLFLDCSYS